MGPGTRERELDVAAAGGVLSSESQIYTEFTPRLSEQLPLGRMGGRFKTDHNGFSLCAVFAARIERKGTRRDYRARGFEFPGKGN